MSETQIHQFARAVALANGHPDPAAYADLVEGHFNEIVNPAPVPAPEFAPAPPNTGS